MRTAPSCVPVTLLGFAGDELPELVSYGRAACAPETVPRGNCEAREVAQRVNYLRWLRLIPTATKPP